MSTRRALARRWRQAYMYAMGSWGDGILQNDSAQDSLIEAGNDLEAEVAAIAQRSRPDDWPRLLGSVGLLIHFANHAFDPECGSTSVLADAIARHRQPTPYPELEALVDGLAAKRAPDFDFIQFPDELETILHGPNKSTFGVQKGWARLPEGCLEHPAARALVQEFADRRVAKIDEDFENEDAVGDPLRESFAIGDLALLLVLEHIHVDSGHFERWRQMWHEGRWPPEDGEHDELEEYNKCLERAFQYGVRRFSAAK